MIESKEYLLDSMVSLLTQMVRIKFPTTPRQETENSAATTAVAPVLPTSRVSR